tara:strand:+ start:1269 stop:1562 length:294 start_codon:yes stop_codon:yes gene_type:complete
MANRIKSLDGKIVPLTAEEEKQADADLKAWNDGKADRELAELRSQRNSLLSETDYMGNSDVTISDAWKTYRQELRDITKKFKSMNDKDFKFPEKPKD